MRKQRFQRPLYYVFSIIVCLSLLLQTSPLVAFAAEKSASLEIPAADPVAPNLPAPLPVNSVNTSQTAKIFTAKSYPTSEASLLATLQPPSPSLDEIALLSNWNLLSLPKEAPDNSPTAVFADIAGQYNTVYAYDGCNSADPWQLFDPSAPPVTNDLTAVPPAIGFWIQATQNTTLPIAGTVPPSTTIQICTGWNLIGMPTEQARPVRNALFSIDGKYSLVFGYDPTDAEDPWEIYDVAAPEWANDLQFMQPGRGYWVLATEDATLTISNEGEPPIAEIITPADSPVEIAAMTGITDVIGTAVSDMLAGWELSYRPQDGEQWISFAAGVTPVISDTLDQFDPTLLINGVYEIRLDAIDYAGVIAYDTVFVTVEGDQKPGVLTLPFLDADVDVAGLPIQVVRTYDSRDKEVGDFGVGWQLGLSQVRLIERGVPGDRWQSNLDVPGGVIPFFSYILEPQEAHLILILFPDGTLYKFRPTIVPDRQLLVPPTIVNMEYTPIDGTDATLVSLDQSGQSLQVVGSFPPPPIDVGDGPPAPFTPPPVQLWTQGEIDLYNPNLYRLTLPDGRQFVIHQTNGLQSITDLNGNVLTMTSNGINHSRGVGLTFERDTLGRITQITDPLSHTVRYLYDSAGDLVQVIDQNHLTTTFTYVDDHYLDTIIDPEGNELAALDFDANGRITAACNGSQACVNRFYNLDARQQITTDPTGRQVTHTYDDRGNITAVTDGLGNTRLFNYDNQGNLLQQTDPTGVTIRYAYDAHNNMVAKTQPFHPSIVSNIYTTTYTYNNYGQILTIVEPTGTQTSFDYDNRGNLLDVRDNTGNIIASYTYDSNGHITSEGGPFDTSYYQDFDSLGNSQITIDPFGNVITATYDIMGNLTAMRNEGLLSTVTYDEQGRPLTQVFGDGGAINYEYESGGGKNDWTVHDSDTSGRTERIISPDGQLTGWILPDGRTLNYEYDAADRLLQETDPFGNTTEYTYDAIGRIASIESPMYGGVVTYEYDSGSRIISQTTTLGTQSFTYYPDGSLETKTNELGYTWAYTHQLTSTTTIDPLGRQTTVFLSAEGQPVRQINPDGSTLSIEYLVSHSALEPQEYPTQIIDQGGNIRSFTYDEFGRLATATDLAGITYTLHYSGEQFVGFTNPLSETITLTNDNEGYITSVTYPNGSTRYIEYDISGKPLTITQPSGAFINFTFDQFGQEVSRVDSEGNSYNLVWVGNSGILSATIDATGITQYSYDNLGQLTNIVYPNQSRISYGYDTFGQVITVTTQVSITAPAFSTSYEYDALGNLTNITDPLGGITTREYDMVGRLITQTLPNDVTSIYTYNELDQVTSLVHRDSANNIIASFVYERVGIGEPSKITREDGSYVLLGYDAALRLESEAYYDTGNNLQEIITYTYDLAGNRITHSDNTGTYTYEYDPGYQLTGITGPATAESYDYDQDGRTSQIVRDNITQTYEYDSRDFLTVASNLTNGTTISYTYDALGRRVQANDATGERQFLVAPILGQELESPHAIFDENGQAIANYVYAGQTPLMRFGPEGPIYYLPDVRGSVVALADNNGLTVASFQYDGFGNIRGASGSGQVLPVASGGDFRFQGAWLEAATGLYHFPAREYDPQTGRFLSRDAADPEYQTPETANSYQFALANPYIYRDPTGHFTVMELNMGQAVQSSLRSLQAQLPRVAIGQAKEAAADFITDLLLDFLMGWLPPLDALVDSHNFPFQKGREFENLTSGLICLLLFGTNNPGVLNVFHLEVSMWPETGEPVTDGLKCDTGVLSIIPGTGRPDFLFSQYAPTTLKPGGRRRSLLVGDFKLRVSTATRKWKPNDNQWEAMTNHAARYQYAPIALLIAWRSSGKDDLQILANRAKDKGVILFVITMD